MLLLAFIAAHLCTGLVAPVTALQSQGGRVAKPNVLFAGGIDDAVGRRMRGSGENVTESCDVFRTFMPPDSASMEPAPLYGEHYDVIIGVLTAASMHETRALPHYSFHARNLPDSMLLLYFTNGEYLNVSDSLHDKSATSSYKDAQRRYLKAWRFIGAGCLGLSFKWFLQIDDDAALSTARFGIFLNALEARIGDPERNSWLIGRHAWWHDQPCGELYGGNGLLASRKAVQDIASADDGLWEDAFDHVSWYDSIVSQLAYHAGCGKVFMNVPFGLGFHQKAVHHTNEMPMLLRCYKSAGQLGEVDEGSGHLHDKDIDMTHLSGCLAEVGDTTHAFTLHRARSPKAFRAAGLLFSSAAPTMESYAALLDGTRDQFEKPCLL